MGKYLLLMLMFLFLFLGADAFADQPHLWQLGTQEAATPIMRMVESFHSILLCVIFAIALFVTVLLVYTVWRFHHKRNPNPVKFTHNVTIEIIWTVIPLLILILIAVPSFKLLYYQEQSPEPGLVVKTMGYQWYWGYEYPEHGISFDSYIKKAADLKDGEPRLLEVDNRLVVPIKTNVLLMITAADVIHSWTVPSFGVKCDAVPGRLNQLWFYVDKPGVYYGQCSELCGREHGFMPIAVEAVEPDEFKKWVEKAKEKFGA